MELITLYEVHEWDGGERTIWRGTCSRDITVARAIAGGPHDAIVKRVSRVYDSVEDFKRNTEKALRERALAKLTPEERDALGLL